MRRTWLLASALALAACDDDMSAPAADAASTCLHPQPDLLPPPSKPCLAGCGNELGVGQPCTKGGFECSDLGLGNAIFCTVDQATTDLAFCTRPCVVDEQCGRNAYCAGDPSDPGAGRGCFPAAPWRRTPPADAGTSTTADAGP